MLSSFNLNSETDEILSDLIRPKSNTEDFNIMMPDLDKNYQSENEKIESNNTDLKFIKSSNHSKASTADEKLRMLLADVFVLTWNWSN